MRRCFILLFTVVLLMTPRTHLWAEASQVSAEASTAATSEAISTGPSPLTAREQVVHILNRLAFGPTPGQVDTVLETGWEAWVRTQLLPDDIDDGALDAQLEANFPSLFMSMGDIFDTYQPDYAGEYPTREERRREAKLRQKAQIELRKSVISRAVFSRRQFQEVIVEFWRNHFNVDHNKDEVAYLANHFEQHVIREHAFGRFGDMLMASAKHPAMLIYLDNAVSQKPLSDEEEEEAARHVRRRRLPESVLKKLRRQSGLNENYARELMELHTLGVEYENRKGGYSQRDVEELARVLTGWTAGFWNNDEEYGFVFRNEWHDRLPKIVRGRRMGGRGGIAEGEGVIKRLATDRRTAAFISRKLCRYLVNDEPPESLVKRVAGVFRISRGYLPKVYEAIIFSPQFMHRDNYLAKFKTPFEFTISALRATEAQIDRYAHLYAALTDMGQPVYGQEDPTGYLDQAEAWLDPGVLLHRWHFALQLAEGRVEGVRPSQEFIDTLIALPPQEMKQRMVAQLLPAGIDPHTDAVLDSALESFGLYRRQMLGLLIGTPAFQQQ